MNKGMRGGGLGEQGSQREGRWSRGHRLEMGCGAWALEPALLALGVPLEEGL